MPSNRKFNVQRKEMVIQAETGAGKSSSVPRFLVEAALRSSGDCCIAVGVLRKAAARALALRVAEEAGEDVDVSIGLFTEEDKVYPTQ